MVAPVQNEPVSESEATEVAPLSDPDLTRAVAEYLADMIGQLELMAKNSRLDLLVYLLSMAKAEAQVNAHPGPPQRSDA